MKDSDVKKHWTLGTLGEAILGKPQYGLTARSSTQKKEIIYVRISDITDEGELKTEGLHYVDANSEVDKYVLQENDFLIARSGSVGRVYLHTSHEIDRPAVFASYLIRFKLDPSKIMPRFALYLGLSQFFKIEIQARKKIVAQPNINAKDYCRFRFPIAPLEVQRRIVEILDEARRIQKKRELANNITNKIVNSLFLKMFGDPVSKQKHYAILKEVCLAVESGSTPLRSNALNFDAHGTCLIKVENINSQGYLLTKENQLKISTEANQKQKRSVIKAGDVLINIVGPPLGKVAFVTKEFDGCNINQAVVLMRVNPLHLSNRYLWSLLRYPSFNRQIIDMGLSVRQANINLSEIRDLRIPLPPIETQNSFQSKVDKIEKIREKQHQSTEATSQLFESLMQKAFRGEIAVRDRDFRT